MSNIVLILIVFLSFNGTVVSVSEISFNTMERCISAGNLAMKDFNIRGGLTKHNGVTTKAICVYR